jgi:outer membrane receptor for ferric coprogen and ferric-rhodotorulic acid
MFACPSPLARSIRQAALTLSLSGSLLVAGNAWAEPISYNIPAGDLAAALSQFAADSGVTLSFSSSETVNLKSSELQGEYEVEEGFTRLLKGSGLGAQKAEDKRYVLVRIQSEDLELGAATITGTQLAETTEGSGSYTTGAMATATKLPLSIRETPQTVTVVTRQQMDDQGALTVGDVLENTPGISVQSFDSNRQLYFTRGFDITNYQYDGVNTIVDNIYEGSPHGDTVAYDRIEIVKGATGLMTGSGDPAATVNLIRKKPTRDFKASITGMAGSWDNYRTEGDISGSLNDEGTLRGRLVGAYQDRQAYQDHYKQKNDALYGILEADLSPDTLLTFGIDRNSKTPRGVSWTGTPVYNSDGSKTDFSRSFNPGAKWSRRDFESTTYFASLQQGLSNDWTLKVSLDHMITDHDTRLASASGGNPDPDTGEGMFYYWGRWEGHRVQNSADVNLSGPFELFGREHDLVIGAMAAHSKLTGDTYDGSAFSLVPGNIHDWDGNLAEQDFPVNGEYETTQSQNGIYLATRLHPTDDLSLILGTRVSTFKYNTEEDYFVNTDIHASYKEHGVVTPYAGVVYDLDETYSVYASYTAIYQPQTNKDASGATLAPVEGNAYEAGLKAAYLDGKLNATLAFFRIEEDNVAQFVETLRPPGGTRDVYQAIEGATTKGVELELSGELMDGWNLSAGYTYARSRDADEQRVFGYPLATTQPEQVARLFTTYRLPGALERVTVGGGVKWQSAFYGSIYNPVLDASTLIKQSDYTLVGLMTRYQHNEHLSFTLNANNVFNKKYLSGLGNFDTTYYGESRNLMLTTRWDF